MKIRTMFFAIMTLLFFGVGIASACDGYKDLSTDDLKSYRDKLAEVDADPLDKFFAFQELYCSSNPVLRAYAAKAGLEGNADPIIRQQIMLILLMDMKHINIELTADSKTTPDDKEFFKKKDGKLSFLPTFLSEPEGCIGIYYDSECNPNYSLFIKGAKVELYYDRIYGIFELADSNELVGYIRLDNREGNGRIQAVIKLD